MAMMSSCLVIAQNGRYGGLSTQATGLFARRWVSAVCNRSSSAYAVGSASTLAASSIVRGLIGSPEGRAEELDGCQVRSLGDRHSRDPGFRPKACVGSDSVQPGTARSLRVVLLVVLATVLVVALGRLVGASPQAAVPRSSSRRRRWFRRPRTPGGYLAGGNRRGTGARRRRIRPPIVRRYPLRRTACRPAALPAACARARRGRASAMPPNPVRDASRTPARDPEFGKQSDEDCLSLNVWTPRMTGRRAR